MIPIIRRLENIDLSNPMTAIKQLVEHIRDLENQIEDLLMKIDNVNMLPLDLGDMEFYTDNGSRISGDRIKIKEIVAESITADTITRGGVAL